MAQHTLSSKVNGTIYIPGPPGCLALGRFTSLRVCGPVDWSAEWYYKHLRHGRLFTLSKEYVISSSSDSPSVHVMCIVSSLNSQRRRILCPIYMTQAGSPMLAFRVASWFIISKLWIIFDNKVIVIIDTKLDI